MDSDKMAEEVYSQVFEEIITEIIFQVEIDEHFEQSIKSQLKKYTKEHILPLNDLDIFGNSNSKEANECVCPNCGRTLGALRFAPHLEKCVGMGRSSSRIANRRILASSNSGKDMKYFDDPGDGNGVSQMQSNVEWVPPKATRKVDSRKKRDRSGRHKNKKKLEEIASVSHNVTDEFTYSNMSHEQRQNILAHMCGVVSEHTGRLCTRSIRCPKHSEEQRNSVRLSVLSNNAIQSDFAKMNMQEGQSIEDIEMLEIEPNISISPIKKSDKHYRLK